MQELPAGICENRILLRATEFFLLMWRAQKSTDSCAYYNTEYIQIDILFTAVKPQHIPSLLTKLQYSKIWSFLARSERKWLQAANCKKVEVYSSLDLKSVFYFWLQATNNKEKKEGNWRLTMIKSEKVLCAVSWTLKITQKKSI